MLLRKNPDIYGGAIRCKSEFVVGHGHVRRERKRISISGTLSLGAATQRHIRAQRTRPKCRRCCTALDGHLFLSRLLILPSQQSRDLEVIEKVERYRLYGLPSRKSENICQRSVDVKANPHYGRCFAALISTDLWHKEYPGGVSSILPLTPP